MPNPTTHRCPHCRTKIRASTKQFGRTARCPKCGERFKADNSTVVLASPQKPVREVEPVVPEFSPPDQIDVAEVDIVVDAQPIEVSAINVAESTEASIVRRPRFEFPIVGVLAFIVMVSVAGLMVWATYSWFRAPTTEEIVANNEASIAVIEVPNGVGTGFLVKEKWLATNSHVIEGALLEEVKVHFPSASKEHSGPFTATLLYEDRDRDLAILEVDTALDALTLASNFEFRRGESIVIIGNPGVGDKVVLKNAVNKGVMSTETTIDGHKFYQLGASINAGNSGGPVLNSSGEVIGVATLRASKEESLAFCIPLQDVADAIEQISHLSGVERKQAAAKHRAVLAYSMIESLGRVYVISMQSFSDSMNRSITDGGSAQTGLDAAIIVFKEPLQKTNVLRSKAETLMTTVGSDDAIDSALRSKLIDFWTNTREIYGYLDNPRGNYTSYSAKTRELRDEHDRLSESLRLSLGIKK